MLQSSKRSLVLFAKDIKISHSIFALPFAFSALLLKQIPGAHSLSQFVLLLVCMVSARSFAMGMNRYLDRQIDAINPRTKVRLIPSGQLSPNAGLFWSVVAATIFIAASFGLNNLAGILSLPVLLILGLYPFWKKISWLTHWYLGACLGLAPVAVGVAWGGQIYPVLVLLGLAVAFWTGGFDVIYALQDFDFDRRHGLKSIPAKLGPAKALVVSRLSFVVMVGLLVAIGQLITMGSSYYFGVAIVAGILAYEHYLVRDAKNDGHSKNVNVAFFNMNAAVGVIYFVFCLLDRML